MRSLCLIVWMAGFWLSTVSIKSVLAETVEQSEGSMPTRPRLFRAEGTHKCWSDTSIGHDCYVHGVQYVDCREAYEDLKRWDCCPGTEEGGSSVEFKLTQCSAYFYEK